MGEWVGGWVGGSCEEGRLRVKPRCTSAQPGALAVARVPGSPPSAASHTVSMSGCPGHRWMAPWWRAATWALSCRWRRCAAAPPLCCAVSAIPGLPGTLRSPLGGPAVLQRRRAPCARRACRGSTARPPSTHSINQSIAGALLAVQDRAGLPSARQAGHCCNQHAGEHD